MTLAQRRRAMRNAGSKIALGEPLHVKLDKNSLTDYQP
jgi:hypothetical protein